MAGKISGWQGKAPRRGNQLPGLGGFANRGAPSKAARMAHMVGTRLPFSTGEPAGKSGMPGTNKR
jgi:hypothetical protein